MLFATLLRSMVRTGGLVLIDHAGRRYPVGDDARSGLVVRLRGRSLGTMLALNPQLSIGEAYANGTLIVEGGSLLDFLTLLARNLGTPGMHRWATQWGYWTGRAAATLQTRNSVSRSVRNIAHHYDLPASFYDLFLDSNRQYSCAYFKTPEDNLETAQRQKMLHIAAKLRLDRPGLRVLDIGSGWGGLACCLAAHAGCDVTGVTLSAAQHAESQASAQRAGLQSQVRFNLTDYREMRGQYDRIVSVGMFEHVGRSGYGEFFSSLRGLLRDDGVALLHAIGDSASPSPINPFIQKYIFPGAAVPSLSEVLAAVERSGLVATDIEILRLHYAETLARWRERFVAAHAEVARLYGERLFRTWAFYFTLCEVGFRHRTSIVFQLQLARRNDTLPITRDYMEVRNLAAGGNLVPAFVGGRQHGASLCAKAVPVSERAR